MIVLHVRSIDDDKEALAAEKTLQMLIDFGLQEAPIHRHCFIGESKSITTGALNSQTASLAFPVNR